MKELPHETQMSDDARSAQDEVLPLSSGDEEVERRTRKTAITMAVLGCIHIAFLVANGGVLDTPLIVSGAGLFLMGPLGTARAMKSFGGWAKHAMTLCLVTLVWGISVYLIAFYSMRAG